MALPSELDFNKWDGSKFTYQDIDGNTNKLVEILTSGAYDLNVNKVTANNYQGLNLSFGVLAGESITKGDVIRISNGVAFKADSTSSDTSYNVVGIATNSASGGDQVNITYGYYDEFTGLIPGNLYYVGANGALLASPSSDYPVQIGRAITSERLNIDIKEDSTPAGTIISFGGTNPAPGYVICDGREINRNTHARLFNAIGFAYGAGDGSSTFNVPDLSSRYLRGAGSGAAIGEFLEQATKLPANPFSGTTNTGGSHYHISGAPYEPNYGTLLYGYVNYSSTQSYLCPSQITFSGKRHPHTSTHSGHEHSFTVGGGGDSETRPNSIIVNYMIRL